MPRSSMWKVLLASIFTAFMAGCAGLEVGSLSTEAAKNAHTQGNELNGYIVYHPMVVVEIGEKELCVERNDKGQCKKIKTTCGVGDLKSLPDYSKPYLLAPKAGLGKIGIEVTIEEGWRLGGIKDESDNTALLGVLAAAVGIESAIEGAVSAVPISGCSDPGLYQVKPIDGGIQLIPILMY